MSFFRQVKDSFTNFEEYREIAGQKRGRTFKYFIILYTLVFIIGGLRMAWNFNAGAAQLAETVREEVPEFRLADGVLTVEGPQPIVIDGDNATAMIIDTTGQVDESVLSNYDEGIFVSGTKIVNKQYSGTNEYKFADYKQMSLDKQKLLSYLPMIKWLLPVLAFLMYLVKMVWVLVTTVILALIGLMINSARKGQLDFNNTWNMAVYAFTLPWLLEMIKNLAYPMMPSFWLLKWGIAFFILFKAIEAVTRPAVTDEVPKL